MAPRSPVMLLVLLAMPLSGCLGDTGDPLAAATGGDAAPLHPLLPGVTTDLPSGPGVVRYITHDNNATTRVVGLELTLDPGDVDDEGRYRVELVPFGNVEEWAVLPFEDGAYTGWAELGFPYTVEVDYDATAPLPTVSPRNEYANNMWFSPESKNHLIVAVRGDGGIALVPDGAVNGPPSTLDDLRARSGGAPAIIGESQGMTYARFTKFVVPGLGGVYTHYGNVEIQKDQAFERAGSPATALTISAPPGLPGWSFAQGRFLAFEGAGEWHSTVTAGNHMYERAGPFAVVGVDIVRPVGDETWFYAQGDAGTGVSTSLQVLAAADITSMRFEQLTLGASVDELLGLRDDFWYHSPYPATSSLGTCPTEANPRCLDAFVGAPTAPLRHRVLGGP